MFRFSPCPLEDTIKDAPCCTSRFASPSPFPFLMFSPPALSHPFFLTALHHVLTVSHFPVSVGSHCKGCAQLYAVISLTLPLPFFQSPFFGFSLFSSLLSGLFFHDGSACAHPFLFLAACCRSLPTNQGTGGYRAFCTILFPFVVHCQIDRHVFSFRRVLHNCRLSFSPPCDCAFLRCFRFLTTCTSAVCILAARCLSSHLWPP